MKRFDTVAIVGVGLIGASIGLAIQRRGAAGQVIGIGRRSARLRKALRRGAVHRITTDLASGVAAADLVIVCTPVASIVPLARQVAAACPAAALITDAGSTKANIVSALDRHLARKRAARGPGFVGSHPLAGDHRTGAEHARADLFEGRTVVVTPTPRSVRRHVAGLRAFWRGLGSRVVSMTPAVHDRALAATSHVPHLVASALAAATPEAHLDLVAGGWLDSTRIAAGDPALWHEILLDNRANVLRSLARVERMLGKLRAALDPEDEEQLNRLLAQAKRRRDAVGS